MPQRQSPRRVVKRETPAGDRARAKMDKGQMPNPIESGTATLEGLIAGLLDLLSPKTEPQDIELPNPEGWRGTDPRIKEHLGVPDDGSFMPRRMK